MSCQNNNSPIDININNISGKCDYKCNYNFYYNNSTTQATNRGDYISLTYDYKNSPQVIFNANSYNVKEIRIYYPSLHSYNSIKTDAEMIIIHTSNFNPKQLLVCVPIIISNSTSKATEILDEIINTMSSSAVKEGETTTINVSDFNLNDFVPKKPYYYYSGLELYQPCSSDTDYIVFDNSGQVINISSDSFNKMKSFIKSNSYVISSIKTNYYYNESGPDNSLNNNSEIYINCSPVGESDEEVLVISDNKLNPIILNIDYKSILNSLYFQIIIGFLIFIGLIYLFNSLFTNLNVSNLNTNILSRKNIFNFQKN